MARPTCRERPTEEQRPPSGAVAIPLTKGWVAWVDQEDASRIGAHPWYALEHRGHGTALRKEQRQRKARTISMHHEVYGAKTLLDHVRRLDRVKVVDNRKANLRPATPSQNMANRQGNKGGTSPFKGVSRVESRGRWLAQIKDGGCRRNLGRYRRESDAALAYDLAAVAVFGDRALTNFPIPGSTNWLF